MKPFLLIATRPEDDLAEQELHAFLLRGGLQPHELVHVRLEREPLPPFDPDSYSGIMLGGSPFDTSAPQHTKSATQVRVEKDLMALLDVIVPLDFPFLGACYGVGTLAAHQGGLIDSRYSEDAGATTITLTDEGLQDPIAAGIGTNFRAFVGHHEACSQLPAHALLLASSESCPVQMFRIRENMYGTQFHPELDVPGFLARIDRYRGNGYFADFDAVADAALGEDMDPVGRIIANFVERYAR